jgi:hypothetical protein
MAAQFEGFYPVDLTKQWLARSGQVVIDFSMRQPGVGVLRSETTLVINFQLSPIESPTVATAGERD